jgi:hypothetical protein
MIEKTILEVPDYQNSTELQWKEFPDLNYQRHHACYFVFNNKYLYVFFGYNGTRGSIPMIERINVEIRLTWEVVNLINVSYLDMHMDSHGIIYANNDEVYIVGGCIRDKYSDKIFKYNFIQNAIYLSEMKIPGLLDNEYYRFWEETSFKSLSSDNQFITNDEDEYAFGMFDAREKFHIFNPRTLKYDII